MPLDELDPLMLQQFRGHLRKLDYSGKTLNRDVPAADGDNRAAERGAFGQIQGDAEGGLRIQRVDRFRPLARAIFFFARRYTFTAWMTIARGSAETVTASLFKL